MGLRNVARAVHERGQAGLREQRGFGPEIDGVADGQAQFVGEIARGKTTLFRRGDVACRQLRPAKGFGIAFQRAGHGAGTEARMQCIDVVRRQWAEAETHFRAGRNHVRLDPALDLADVEAQAGQAAETRPGFAFDQVQRVRAPAHRLVQRCG